LDPSEIILKLSLKFAAASACALLVCHGALARETNAAPLEFSGSLDLVSNACALTFPRGGTFDVGAHQLENFAADKETWLKDGTVPFSIDCTSATPLALTFSTTDTLPRPGSSLNLALSADKTIPLVFGSVYVADATTGGASPIKAGYALTGASSTPLEIDGYTTVVPSIHSAFVHGFTNGDFPDNKGITFVDDSRNVISTTKLTGKFDMRIYATPTELWGAADRENRFELNGKLTVAVIYN
jgi:hypothetical protein